VSDDRVDDGHLVRDEIPAALADERLDRVVSLITSMSRSEAATVIAAGGVLLDGVVAHTGKVRVHEGQTVDIDLSLRPTTERPRPDPSVVVPVVFEDEHLVIIDKPPGLVVHPAPGHDEGTLVNGLLARYPEIADVGDPARPGIVHRLDVGTSGLMLVARSGSAYDQLVSALSDRDITRVYDALVWGRPASPSGIIDAPIGRDPRDPLRMAVVVTGRPARTRYSTTTPFVDPEVTLLRCQLETGRTHQIRVHLAAIGHPVVGDGTYGGNRPALSSPRPFLHAAQLSLLHPVTAEPVLATSPMPDDLAEVLRRCTPEPPSAASNR
jgi:23S rRNA pseudouridine1911/1915/1917 synthase